MDEVHIVGMPAAGLSITTVDQLLALPEDGMRHELLDGVHVVTPTPRLDHQRFVGHLTLRLHHALSGHDELEVFGVPGDIQLGPDTLVEPDLFVIRQDPANPARTWEEVGLPVLVVEVLSPVTASRDRGVKRKIYQRAGVPEYWIVDLDARLFERWTPEDARPEIVDTAFTWRPDARVAVEVPVKELFRGTTDD